MSTTEPQFSQSLASLRGVAAVVVVIYHALLIFRVGDHDNPHRSRLDLDEPWLVLTHAMIDVFNGPAAVVLFFVLSGTVLALSLQRGGEFSAPKLAAYYLRRLFRLMPLLVAVSMVAALLHWFYFEDLSFEAATSWMNNYYNHQPSAAEVALNAVGLSNSLNSPAWTIRIEIIASILFPVLFLLCGRKSLIVAGTIGLVALMYMPLQLRSAHVYLFSFFVGALIAKHGSVIAQIFNRSPRSLRIASIIGALAVMVLLPRVFRPWAHVDPTTVLVITICAAFIVAVTLHGPRNKVLQSRFLNWLGDISYGVYLIHFGVLFGLAHFVAEAVGDLTPQTALALNIALAVATLAITIPLAALAYYTLERPFQELGRRVSQAIQASSENHEPSRVARLGEVISHRNH